MKTLRLLAALVLALPAALPAAERTGEEIVKSQCAKCHAAGVDGAPRIEDRAAWVPRVKRGVDATVASAIKGHGKMPARGGLADLTDTELRSAILYMFNPAGIPPRPAAAPPAGANQRVVDGTEIYLGVIAKPGGMHQVSITLRDGTTHQAIENAQVEARVTDLLMGAESRRLVPMKAGDGVSYAADFRISGKEPHVITVHVKRPGSVKTLEAKFDYRS
jgi:cytochrome c5